MSPDISTFYPVSLLLVGVLLLVACLWPRLHGGDWDASQADVPATALRALATGGLAGGAVSLAGAAFALWSVKLAPGSLGPVGEALAQPAVIAAGCVVAFLLFFEGPGPGRTWLLLGAGVAAVLPWAFAPHATILDPEARLAPLPLGAIAAALCGLALSPTRRARVIELAHIAATRAAGDAILVVDQRGRVLHANPASSEALGIEASGGSRRSRRSLPPAVRELLTNPKGNRVRLKSSSSKRFFEAWTTPRRIRGPLKGVRALLLRDVTGQRRDQRRLVRLAHYDSLTGLANRRLFLEHLGQALEQATRESEPYALLYLDLDHFKEINDSLGHAAGDELLETLADRFREFFRKEDLSECGFKPGARVQIARLAGDEFAIVASRATDPEAAAELARQLLALIAQPIEVAGRSLTHSASVGIAMFPEDAKDVETLIRHADIALYAAKSRGRNRHAFYESSFDARAERTHAIEQGLRRALECGELHLHYQPKVDVTSSTVVGFEALLRWKSSELGDVGPGEFIPIAEERGLISEIGSWCLDEACREIRSWAEEGFSPVPVSVNVSSLQFQQTDLQAVVSESLKRHAVDPQLLELELTESLLLEEAEHTALALRDLRSIGVRIALDDFGTGYSALTYLNRFPLDVLKMDRGLLLDIENNPAAVGIAAAVVSMAHSLGLIVVAEGIDSEGQLPILRQMNCDQIQGFLYAPALPPQDARRFLSERGKRPRVAEPGRKLPGRLQAGPGLEAAEPDPDVERAAEQVGATAPAEPGRGAEAPLAESTPTPPSDLPAACVPQVVEPDVALAPPEQADVVVRADDSGEVGRRVLLVDDGSTSLGSAALRLARLGVDVHYAADPDEGMMFIAQETSAIRLLVAPPSLDPERTRAVRDALSREIGSLPVLVVIGEEPDAAARGRIRDAGATWILWSPFDDTELAFVIRSALALPRELAQRRELRVPVDLVAKVQAGRRREMALLSSLSARGAFIEVNAPLPVDSQLRLEFELPTHRFRLFARVVHQQVEDLSRPISSNTGMGVVFYGLDRETELALRKAVEDRAARYLP